MSNLYKNIAALCEERGIKGAKLCNDIGMSKGILTDLKMGRKAGVNAVTAQKIASYFGVSVGYLLGEEEQTKKPADNVGELDEDLLKISELISSLHEDRLDAALEIAQKISVLDDAEVNAILAVVRSMGRK